MELVNDIQPEAIIEAGEHHGGSFLHLADYVAGKINAAGNDLATGHGQPKRCADCNHAPTADAGTCPGAKCGAHRPHIL